jgi:hypothetical protein
MLIRSVFALLELDIVQSEGGSFGMGEGNQDEGLGAPAVKRHQRDDNLVIKTNKREGGRFDLK